MPTVEECMSMELRKEEEQAFFDTLKDIPFVGKALHEYRLSAYGGFVRFAAETKVNKDRFPTLDECLDYITKRDIDLSCTKHEGKSDDHSISYLRDLQDEIIRLDCKVAYIGNDYDNYDRPAKNRVTLWRNGSYHIWVPHEDRMLHVDLFVHGTTCYGWGEDFSVNCGRISSGGSSIPMKAVKKGEIDYCVSMNGIKLPVVMRAILRSQKMESKGYTMTEKSATRMLKHFLSAFGKYDEEGCRVADKISMFVDVLRSMCSLDNVREELRSLTNDECSYAKTRPEYKARRIAALPEEIERDEKYLKGLEEKMDNCDTFDLAVLGGTWGWKMSKKLLYGCYATDDTDWTVPETGPQKEGGRYYVPAQAAKCEPALVSDVYYVVRKALLKFPESNATKRFLSIFGDIFESIAIGFASEEPEAKIGDRYISNGTWLGHQNKDDDIATYLGRGVWDFDTPVEHQTLRIDDECGTLTLTYGCGRWNY